MTEREGVRGVREGARGWGGVSVIVVVRIELVRWGMFVAVYHCERRWGERG